MRDSALNVHPVSLGQTFSQLFWPTMYVDLFTKRLVQSTKKKGIMAAFAAQHNRRSQQSCPAYRCSKMDFSMSIPDCTILTYDAIRDQHGKLHPIHIFHSGISGALFMCLFCVKILSGLVLGLHSHHAAAVKLLVQGCVSFMSKFVFYTILSVFILLLQHVNTGCIILMV